MEIRYTAKGLVGCENKKMVFVAGKRGMWNLPGGGIDEGETAKDAFLREADEEVDNFSDHFTDPVEAFTVQGPTTSADGVRKLAHWVVFESALLIPSSKLSVPADSEITAITAFTPEECLGHPNMSDLAKSAVRQAIR